MFSTFCLAIGKSLESTQELSKKDIKEMALMLRHLLSRMHKALGSVPRGREEEEECGDRKGRSHVWQEFKPCCWLVEPFSKASGSYMTDLVRVCIPA